jgi:hypothetical protein
MKIKNFTLIADAIASTIGAVTSYLFFCYLVPIAFSEFELASVSVVSALFTFYVFRKNVTPMTEKRKVWIPFYFFEVITVMGATFFALMGTFFGFLFWKYLILPYLPEITNYFVGIGGILRPFSF